MAKKQAYVVLVGLKPGVYRKWLDVTQNVVGVPRAQHEGFTYWQEAVDYYERAHRNGATKTVTKPPPPTKCEEQPQTASGERQGPSVQAAGGRQRRRQDTPARNVQAPTSRGSSAGKAARDARIAAALAEARRDRIEPSASSPSVSSSGRRQPDKSSRHALTRSATEPAYHLQLQDPQTRSGRAPPRPARRTVGLPPPDHEPQRRTPVMKTASRGPSMSPSDIPTHQTQTRNRFTNSPSTPRYAQSLSYASSPSSLASSDLRTHISSPSSFGTRYFPEDWLARLGQGDHEVREEPQSPVLSVSEYATAPNTPELGSIELEVKVDVEDTRGLGIANPSPSVRSRVGWSAPSSSRSSTESRSKTRSSATSPPATLTATQVISSPSATSTPRRTIPMSNSVNDRFSPSIASVLPSPPSREPKPATRVTRSLSEAEVQTDSLPQARHHKNPEAAVQFAPPAPPKRQHLDNQVQTSPVASPLRTSTGVGDVPVRPLIGRPPCACEHPEYACIHCGQHPRTEQHIAQSGAGHPRSSRAPSTSTTTASPAPSVLSSAASSSPAPSAAPASAVPSSVSTRSSSSRSLVGGHTPRMGPSELHAYAQSPTARLQASLGMMSFSEVAHAAGTEAVVHDVNFDPRSPIQRGTSVPAGTSGSAVRPSPAMAPVPMGSALSGLGLLFPS